MEHSEIIRGWGIARSLGVSVARSLGGECSEVVRGWSIVRS